ncbi:MAG: hypothetical protein WCJ89_03845 [Actinomycetes bacterium]
MRRKTLGFDDANDATHLAGWVYADLLLGLMVVFLATISFLPIDSLSSQTLAKTINKQVDSGYNYNKGLSLVYSKFDLKSIKSDISKFIVKEDLGPKSQLIFAQILGGYDPKTESSDAGRNRALIYSFKLQNDPDQTFSEASLSVAGTTLLKPNEFALRLSFVSRIK